MATLSLFDVYDHFAMTAANFDLTAGQSTFVVAMIWLLWNPGGDAMPTVRLTWVPLSLTDMTDTNNNTSFCGHDGVFRMLSFYHRDRHDPKAKADARSTLGSTRPVDGLRWQL